ASNQEGLAFRDRAREDLDRAILDAGDAGDDDSYDSLTKLRTATVNDISVRSSRLSPVVPYDTPRSMPSLTLAHRLYGDANRSADLERRNRPPHPAFMPARGEALAE
ncbi:MAG: hypothetical protein HY057_11225, partial [Rhodospirillales bacterium]|nr:hypothetical protein [Rhodospirillales bacterium]